MRGVDFNSSYNWSLRAENATNWKMNRAKLSLW